MKITKRFYEQAQSAYHALTIGHYYPTIDDAYKSGASREKRRSFFSLYFHFIALKHFGKIIIDHIGIVSASNRIFTFACIYTDVETGEIKCYYATPYNHIIINPGKSWEDFKKEKSKGPINNR